MKLKKLLMRFQRNLENNLETQKRMKIYISYDHCIGCKKCVEICPNNVFSFEDELPKITDIDKCSFCGVCADQCPNQAIQIEINKYHKKYTSVDIKVKDDYIELSKTLKEILNLNKNPVAIKLIKNDQELPDKVKVLDFPVRHCVSINMAAHGSMFYLPGDMHACAAAKAALGIEKLPEKVRNGKVPYMHGLAISEKIAARIMDEIPKLPLNTVKGTFVAPLDKIPVEPDVVVLTVQPKQAMWVANSLLYSVGGPRITANFAGMQASCGDVTVVPILKNMVNFSVGCYGCRSAGKLADDEMYVGIPSEKLSSVVSNLKGLRKAMSSLEKTEVVRDE